MEQEKSRAEQLEDLLRELREKRLAQTMELEQIKSDYLNNPSRPIQKASTVAQQLGTSRQTSENNAQTVYRQTAAAPRSGQQTQRPAQTAATGAARTPAQQSAQTAATGASRTPAQRPAQTAATGAARTPAQQPAQTAATGAARTPAQRSAQTAATGAARTPAQRPAQTAATGAARTPAQQSAQTAATGASRTPAQPGRNGAAQPPQRPQAPDLEKRAQELAQKKLDERQTVTRTQELPRVTKRLNETMQFELPKEKPSFASLSNTMQMKAIKQSEAAQEESREKKAKKKRSIFGSLMAEKPDSNSIEFDPINKDMLAPTIERGVDAVPAQEKTAHSRTGEILMPEQKKEYTENHPLFSQSNTAQTFIPPEVRGARVNSPQGGTSEFTRTIPDAVQKSAKKGVLNVRENVDDNFREFFGDTVIIDRESLNDKAKRQRKIKDFVVAEKEGEIGGPVFEDEEEAEEIDSALDYRSDEDTEIVLAQLTADRKKSLIFTAATGCLALVLLVLDFMAELELLDGALSEPYIFYGLNLALLFATVCFCLKPMAVGLGRLVSFRADENSLISFCCLAAAAESAALMFGGESLGFDGACACVAAGAVFFNRLGVYLRDKRILSGFRTVSESYEKYSSAVLDDQNFTRRITRDLDISSPRILVKRKTGFTENFLPHSYSKPQTGKSVSVAASALFLLCILCGVLGFVHENSLFAAMRYMALSAAFTGPFVSTLARYLPIYCMQRSLSKVGAVVPGYSAADEVCDANCVVLEGRELFPKGNVLLHGIKTFERERIDKAILYAASVIIQSCDTMAPMFMNVIQNKTEMLYPVDGVEYESGLGYSFWIDKTRILLGTRDLLRSHEIEVPSRDYESRYTKTNSRDALYLAVAGKLYAMFVISYSPNAEVENALRSFEREGVDVLVHTRDFNITPDKVSRLYQIPRSMVAVVHEDDVAELTKRTDYTGRAPSAITHIGSLSSFVRGIIACYHLRASARLTNAMELACMILGGVVAATLSAAALLSTIGVVAAMFFQLICCLLLTIVACARRY